MVPGGNPEWIRTQERISHDAQIQSVFKVLYLFLSPSDQLPLSDTDVWILFKWNDKGFCFLVFSTSLVWICPHLFPDSERRSPALGIEPQTQCFFPSLHWLQREIGWSRCPEQLRSFYAGPTCAWESVSLWHLRTPFRRSPRVSPAYSNRLFLRCSGIRLSCLVATRRGEMMAAER